MPHDLMISALGTVVRIDASALDESDHDSLHRVWAGAAGPEDAVADGGVVVAPPDMRTDRLLASISQRVTRSAIAARRGQLWMLHAAAVADENGRVVVMIGPSGRGKTTAVRAMAQQYAYVTDETVAIDGLGGVQPYRKPLSIIEEPGAAKAQRPPGELGLRELPAAPLRLAALVLLDRRIDGADDAELERCDLDDALVELAEQTSHLADLPRPLQTIAAHAAAVGGIHRVVYREADSLPGALAPLFRGPAPIAVPTSAESEAGSHDSGDSAPPGWHRAEHLDALALPNSERIAVLQTGSHGGAILRVLDGIGPTLWSSAVGRSTDEMVTITVATHGSPGADDATSILRAAISELAAQGLLDHREEADLAGADTQSHNNAE